MTIFSRFTLITVASTVALSLASGSVFAEDNGHNNGNGDDNHVAGLDKFAAIDIFDNCKESAGEVDSVLRGPGKKTIMWCAVVDREGKLLLLKATDTDESPAQVMATDAWRISIEVAPAKAFTAVSASSNDLALTSRIVGNLAALPPTDPGTLFGIGDTNPYRPLTGNKSLKPDDLIGKKHHGVVTFPGGVPVYSNPDLDCAAADIKGVLLGAVGVSGDGVNPDEDVAKGAVVGIPAVNNGPYCLHP